MRPIASIVLSAAVLVAACSDQSFERRAREAAVKMKESIPDVQAAALAQPVSLQQVERAQRDLAVLNEYQGEITGKLDAVTVNAIEAFQRAHGLKDNGILTEKTEQLLRQAATQPAQQRSG